MTRVAKKMSDTILGLLGKKYVDYSAYTLCALFILAGILVSLNRYWQYEVFYYNFGVFDQAIWKVSRFQAPTIEHVLVGGKWIFADHFNPSILLLSPLYWITDRSEILLMTQAIFAGLAGLVLYKIGIEVLKDKILSLGILACYLFFVGIQNAVITDFHEITVMTLPLAITFWTIIKKRAVLYSIFLLLVLGFKESTFLLGAGIGIFIYFYNRHWRKIALVTIGASLLWGFLAIKVFIPYFSEGVYLHAPSLPDGFINKAVALVDHPLKRETLFYSFLSFVFLLRPKYENYDPDYILIDVRDGQNPNNFLFSRKVDQTLKNLRKDNKYSLEYSTKYQFIFKKKK